MTLPKPTTAAPRAQRGPGSNRPQFFKVEHLQGQPRKVKIESISMEPTQYSDFIIKVTMDGERFNWGLRTNSLAFAALYALFGEDEKKWVGKIFTAKPEHNATFEQDTIVVAK